MPTDFTTNTTALAFTTPKIYSTTAFKNDPNFQGTVSIDGSIETNMNSENFYGYYYNWCLAMGAQSTACTPESQQPMALAGDICPKNWRLPSGGSSYNGQKTAGGNSIFTDIDGGSSVNGTDKYGDWLNLYLAMLSAARKGIAGYSENKTISTNFAGSINFLNSGAFAGVAAGETGYLNSRSDRNYGGPYNSGVVGLYWSSSYDWNAVIPRSSLFVGIDFATGAMNAARSTVSTDANGVELSPGSSGQRWGSFALRCLLN
jgi:hypothetical protein